LFRLWQAGRLSKFRAPLSLIIAALCAVFACPTGIPLNWIFEILAVTVVFPAIIVAGSNAVPKHSLLWCRIAGELSYPAYALQGGFMIHAKVVPLHLGLGPIASLFMTIAMVAVYLYFAWLVLKKFDEPVRAYLLSLWHRKSLKSTGFQSAAACGKSTPDKVA
jgi:peptidoglycan/LPS O-acetylase OafA/YrhL